MKKLPKNLKKVVQKAQKEPGLNIYEMSLSLGVAYRRVFESLKNAEKLGLLKSEVELSNNRCVRRIYPVQGMEEFDLEDMMTGKASELQAYSQKISDKLFKEYRGVVYEPRAGGKINIKLVKNIDPMSPW